MFELVKGQMSLMVLYSKSDLYWSLVEFEFILEFDLI